mmetsp:Transcript_46894/g.124628  ORF Transcript_46894/g.124628 Transcript_46894/m.124628 type:complete len:318 (-) Transcript_46894:107-1060(-)
METWVAVLGGAFGREGLSIAALNCFGMAACAVTGFGENILFQLGWYCLSVVGLSSGSLLQSTPILSAIGLPLNIAQSWSQREHVNCMLAVLGGTVQGCFAILGVAILVYFDGVWLKRCLGAVLCAVFLWRAVVEWRFVRKPSSPTRFEVCQPRNLAMLAVAGSASGVLGGIFSVGGPPFMVFVLVSGIGKDEWRSTQAVATTIMLPVRLTALLWTASRRTQLLALWPQCLIAFLSGLLGLAAGNCIAPHVSEQMFRNAILHFLFVGGVLMLTADSGLLNLVAVLGSVTVAVIAGVSQSCKEKGQSGNVKEKLLTETA